MKKAPMKLINQHSKKGSASILVIMLSLTLIVFGVFSMMTAHAGLAVARRHAEWNTKYHRLESGAVHIAAQLHRMVEEGAAAASGDLDGEANLPYKEQQLIEYIEEGISAKKLPVSITNNRHSTIGEKLLFQAEINIPPSLEERNGFSGILQFMVDMSGPDYPSVAVDTIVWKSVTEGFEYTEGIEFRDVEVEVQVE